MNKLNIPVQIPARVTKTVEEYNAEAHDEADISGSDEENLDRVE